MQVSMNKPMITILMAGYKSKVDLLSKALESIKNQSFKDFEVVFVDDGCGDEALNCLKSFEEFFPITVMHNPVNLGLPRSLNAGIKIAKGKYIARFDDDDLMHEDRLKLQYEFMLSHGEYAGCWTNFTTIDENENEVRTSDLKNVNLLKFFISKGNCCCHSTFMIKKEIIEKLNGYDEKYFYAQDLELYFRVLQEHTMGVVEQPLVRFRTNTTRNPIEKKILSFVFSFSAALKYVYKNQTIKNKMYLLLRFAILFKFVFFDVFKQKDEG